MIDNETRRRELLEHMRNGNVPVIHPRYRATYNSLYQGKEKKTSGILSILLIMFFLGIGYYTYIEKPVIDTGIIIERIEQEITRLVDLTILD